MLRPSPTLLRNDLGSNDGFFLLAMILKSAPPEERSLLARYHREALYHGTPIGRGAVVSFAADRRSGGLQSSKCPQGIEPSAEYHGHKDRWSAPSPLKQ